VEEVSRETLVLALPSHKIGGRFRVLRDRRNTYKRVNANAPVFSWQAQHFVMWPFARSWQAQRFVLWRRCFFDKSHCQGRANVTLLQISWQVQHLVSILESGGSFAKVILVEFEGGLARNARFGTSNFQGEMSFSHFAWQAQDFGSFLLKKLKKPRTKCSF